MGTYKKNQVQGPIGLQIREVVPAIQTGDFAFEFAAAPAAGQFIAPGFTGTQGTFDEAYWVLYSKSVIGWNIVLGAGTGKAPGLAGGSLTIYLGTIQDPDDTGPLAVWPWRVFTLRGEGAVNLQSGLELGGADFARLELKTADTDALGVNCYGSVTVRGV